jgi:hypothetical protein
MTEFHRSYVESEEVAVNSLILKPVNVDYLAVVCRQCRPMKSMNRLFKLRDVSIVQVRKNESGG